MPTKAEILDRLRQIRIDCSDDAYAHIGAGIDRLIEEMTAERDSDDSLLQYYDAIFHAAINEDDDDDVQCPTCGDFRWEYELGMAGPCCKTCGGKKPE